MFREVSKETFYKGIYQKDLDVAVNCFFIKKGFYLTKFNFRDSNKLYGKFETNFNVRPSTQRYYIPKKRNES